MKRAATSFAFAFAGMFGACSSTNGPMPHQPARAMSAIDVGKEPAETQIDLVLSFRLRDAEALRAPRAKRLTPTEFGLAHGASPAIYEDVARDLVARGFEIVRRSEARTTMTVRASAALIEETFSTELRRMHDARGDFRAPSQLFVFPAIMSGVVDAVVGLDDAGRWFPHHREAPPADPNFGPVAAVPADLQGTYRTDQIPQRGEGETIAILGTGTPPSPSGDIGRYITQYMLPTDRVAQYAQVFLGGPNRDDPPFADSEYVENVLDAEIALALAPMASIVHVHTATNAPGLFSDGIAFIVNHVPQAHQVSVSYGTCERYASFEALTLSALFSQARAQGQQWFFASGDNGTDACRDGANNEILTVDWPASAVDVIGVGGTMTDVNNVEIAWNGSGGGQSELIPKPAYQIGVGPYPNDGVRQVPDVAALSGRPFIRIISNNGQSSSVGGTSAAAPMWAAIWSLLDQSRGGQGITNGLERIYQLGPLGLGLVDVTEGNSTDGTTPGFPALVGYDLATGWGTPDAKGLVDNW